jgi:hypothetical protein
VCHFKEIILNNILVLYAFVELNCLTSYYHSVSLLHIFNNNIISLEDTLCFMVLILL